MSCSLLWRPIKDGKSVGDFQLREALRDECGEYPLRLGRGALPFLRGLAAAKVDGAARLIEAIEVQGEIELYLEC